MSSNDNDTHKLASVLAVSLIALTVSGMFGLVAAHLATFGDIKPCLLLILGYVIRGTQRHIPPSARPAAPCSEADAVELAPTK